MAERSKSHLKQEFRDGERPTGLDFADLIDSFITKIDDAVNVDSNSNLNIPGGVNLGNPATGSPGTIRFNGTTVQVFDGGSWTNIGGGGGAFSEVDGGPDVAFDGGNVGIGDFSAAAPTYRFEVNLGNNTANADRVKFGNAVLANGNGAFASAAQFSHADHASGNNNFALRQGAAGDVTINAPANQPIAITHNRLLTRVFVTPAGAVIIGGNAPLPSADATHLLQVNGNAGKTAGGGQWAVLSDVRYKKDIREFTDGLEKLMQVRPVKFKYDGLPEGPGVGQDEVGVIAQEMKKIFPYMISSAAMNNVAGPGKTDDVLMYNGSALMYVMVNSIQELAGKVKDLEAQVAELKQKKAE
jgi:hypothetical protein